MKIRLTNVRGRRTVMTEEVVGKLVEIIKLGVTNQTACQYAQINPDTLYSHLKSNPEFSEKIRAAKMFISITARQVIIKAIIEEKDVAAAKWWLEKKHPDEFGGKAIQANILKKFNEGKDNPELMEWAK